MTIHTRRTIFYLLVFVFLVVGTVLIFYSNGWRFDFETFAIDKLGALYIAASPEGASVKIEKAHFSINPGILKSGILIANLFPKTYRIELSKDGYQSWAKTIAVRPSYVTEMYPVILLPQEPAYEPVKLNDSITQVWVGPRSPLFQLQKKQLLLTDRVIPGTELIAWSSDGAGALTLDRPSEEWHVTRIQNQQVLTTNLTRLLQNTRKERLGSAAFTDERTNLLYLSGENAIYLFDASQFTVTKIQDGPAERFFTIDGHTLWLSKGGIIYPTDSPLPYKDPLYAILNDKLPQQPNLTFLLSPNQKKLALVNDYEPGKIRIYFLEDNLLFNKKVGDFTILDVRRSDNQFAFSWYENSSYLILRLDNRLLLTEIDNNLPTNFQVIAENIRSYAYDQENNAVYFLRPEDGVYKLDL